MTAPATQQEAIQQFIDLANSMRTDSFSKESVSTALMRACAVYSSYVVTGNTGALRPSGVEKIKTLFGDELLAMQRQKAANAGVSYDER